MTLKIGDVLTAENAGPGVRYNFEKTLGDGEDCTLLSPWPELGAAAWHILGGGYDDLASTTTFPGRQAKWDKGDTCPRCGVQRATVTASDSSQFAAGEKVQILRVTPPPAPVEWDGIPAREEKRQRGACPCHGYPAGRCTVWAWEERQRSAVDANAAYRGRLDAPAHYRALPQRVVGGTVLTMGGKHYRVVTEYEEIRPTTTPQTREGRLAAAGFRVEEETR